MPLYEIVIAIVHALDNVASSRRTLAWTIVAPTYFSTP